MDKISPNSPPECSPDTISIIPKLEGRNDPPLKALRNPMYGVSLFTYENPSKSKRMGRRIYPTPEGSSASRKLIYPLLPAISNADIKKLRQKQKNYCQDSMFCLSFKSRRIFFIIFFTIFSSCYYCCHFFPIEVFLT